MSADGGYCHTFRQDGGNTVQCGAWKFDISDTDSSIAFGEFRADEMSDPPNGLRYAYSTEKKGRAKRIIIDGDRATYFVAIDGGALVTP